MTDERELRLLELIDHRYWSEYEATIKEWISDAQELLNTAIEYPMILRLQGNIEALEHILNFKNKWKHEE